MNARRTPDFIQLESVLRRERPERPVLFEMIVNLPVLERLAGPAWNHAPRGPADALDNAIAGFVAGGYDHATVFPWQFGWMKFPGSEHAEGESVGMAHGGVITDRASF